MTVKLSYFKLKPLPHSSSLFMMVDTYKNTVFALYNIKTKEHYYIFEEHSPGKWLPVTRYTTAQVIEKWKTGNLVIDET